MKILIYGRVGGGAGNGHKGLFGKSGSAGIFRDIIFVLYFSQMYVFAVEVVTLH